MFSKILITCIAIVMVFIAVVTMQPPTFRVERSATISAPVPDVFSQVNDLQKFQEWSPWSKLDPMCKTTLEGPSTGMGAIFRWNGNNKVGQGSMTITESRPNELIRFKLEFLRPFRGTNTAEFTFKPEGDQTTVTWCMFGKTNFVSKALGLLMNCDRMVGGQFEKGLAQMKSVTEAAPN